MTISTKDIIWLAGYLEGEGTFDKQRSASLRIKVNSTDLDVIKYVSRIMKAHIYSVKVPQGKKPQWHAVVFGKTATAWMMMLYQFMGERRKQKIHELLQLWKLNGIRKLIPRCHPDRKHLARGLCSPCYQKSRRGGRIYVI